MIFTSLLEIFTIFYSLLHAEELSFVLEHLEWLLVWVGVYGFWGFKDFWGEFTIGNMIWFSFDDPNSSTDFILFLLICWWWWLIHSTVIGYHWLLWAVLGAIGGIIVLWLFSRRRMDRLYGEVSRLREVEAQHQEMLEKEHFDAFIFGHRHLPLEIQLNEKSTYTNLGDWISFFTYAV